MKRPGRKLSWGGRGEHEALGSEEWFWLGFLHLCGDLTFPFKVKEGQELGSTKFPPVMSLFLFLPSSSSCVKCTWCATIPEALGAEGREGGRVFLGRGYIQVSEYLCVTRKAWSLE